MLLVKTKIKPSAIHGIGLFAEEFIPQGTKIWEFHPDFDQVFTKKELNALDATYKDFLKTYTYQYKGKYHLCVDDARFFNHSNSPNCTDIHPDTTNNFHGNDYTLTLKDIQPGEELTSNYLSFGFNDEDHEFNLHWLN